MKLTGKLATEGLHAFDAEPHSHQGHSIAQTWVIVADTRKAMVYRKMESGLEPIAGAAWGGDDAKPVDGHFFKTSEGRQEHDFDARQKQEHDRDRSFIHSLAKWLDMADNEHVFDRLVLAADPHTLGRIRASLSPRVLRRVTGELDKNLTRLSVKDIETHLTSIMVI